jgi:hypothetical protein
MRLCAAGDFVYLKVIGGARLGVYVGPEIVVRLSCPCLLDNSRANTFSYARRALC